MSGGPIYLAEYVVAEGNCTGDVCEPLSDAMAVSLHKTTYYIKSPNLQYFWQCLSIPFFLGSWHLHCQRFELSTYSGLQDVPHFGKI